MKRSPQTTKNQVLPRFIRGSRVIKFQTIVFGWFEKYGRDLPWRNTNDPYAITVSEIMLQQTQVDRVLPKWNAFLLAFPTWGSLADAKMSDVLRAWKGLGYNRRAVMLHRLAKTIIHLGGEIPNDIVVMKTLPGIGDYTANAIAAFAFRHPEAAPVDTNIARIFKRVFPRYTTNAKSIRDLAYCLRPTDVWMWNHALMDIGALACTAKGHNWEFCPLAPLHGKKNREVLILDRSEKSKTARKSVSFEETDRYFRGRIVDVLREGPMSVQKLHRLPVFGSIGSERFATLVQGVVHDGIVGRQRNTVFLVGDEE